MSIYLREISQLKKHLYSLVYCNIIHNQELEISRVSLDIVVMASVAMSAFHIRVLGANCHLNLSSSCLLMDLGNSTDGSTT